MGAARYVGRVGGLAVALGVGAAVFVGHGVASADSDTDSKAGPDATSTSSEDSSASTASNTAKDSVAVKDLDAGGSGSSGEEPPSAVNESGTTPKSGLVVATGGANTKVRSRLTGTVDRGRAEESKRPPGRVAKSRAAEQSDGESAVDATGSNSEAPKEDSGEEDSRQADDLPATERGTTADEDQESQTQPVEFTESRSTAALTSLPTDVDTVVDPGSTSGTAGDPPGPAKDSATALLAAAARRETGVDTSAYGPPPEVVNGVITGTAAAAPWSYYDVIKAPVNGGKLTLNGDTGNYTFLPDAAQLTGTGDDKFEVLVSQKSPLVQLLEQIPILKDFVRPIVVLLHKIPIVGTLLSPIIGSAREYWVDVPVGDFVGGDPIAFTTMVTSFDGVKISVNYFPKAGLAAGTDAPTILNGPSLATAGYTDPTQLTTVFGLVPGLATLRVNYNVVTWDPRGEFASEGRLHLDSEDFEAKDVTAIIDWVTKQPGTELEDGTADPLIGMVGGSYGGGIQLTSAGIDTRIDAISPGIAWNDLTTTLYPHDAFKAAWASLLLLSLVASGSRLDPEIYSGILTGVFFGRLTEEQQDFLSRNSPDNVVDQIKIPTLFLQGTVDTLFPLEQAMENAEAIAENGVPVKMIWYCGGHGQCLDPVDLDQQTTYTVNEIMGWMDKYVMNKSLTSLEDSVDPEKFTWVDQDGNWWASKELPTDPDFYDKIGYEVPGSTGGLLPIVPVFGGSGPQWQATFPVSLVSGAKVDHGALNLSVPNPTPNEITNFVGAPSLTMTYSGVGVSRNVYAQLVDNRTGRVLGNIVSPIPVKLDGGTHTVTVDMEAIAYTMDPANPQIANDPGDSLTLQIFDSATAFEDFTSYGLVYIRSVGLTLPTAADAEPLDMEDAVADAR